MEKKFKPGFHWGNEWNNKDDIVIENVESEDTFGGILVEFSDAGYSKMAFDYYERLGKIKGFLESHEAPKDYGPSIDSMMEWCMGAGMYYAKKHPSKTKIKKTTNKDVRESMSPKETSSNMMG